MKPALYMKAAVLALACVLAAAPLSAEPRGRRAKDRKESARTRVDARTGKRLNEAIDAMQAGRPEEARAKLEKINLNRASPYEVGRIEQLLAAIDQGEEKYGSAREHLLKAVESGGLNDAETSSARFQIAKLYLAEERWQEGIDVLNEWFTAESNPNSAAYYTLAAAYYQLGDADAALEPAQKAVDVAGDNPQETWLQLLLAIRFKREEYALAFPILLRLVERVPEKKVYWVQVASVALSMERYDTATSLLQLAHNAGLLTDGAEIRRLAELLAHEGAPYRAAQILARAIDQKHIDPDSAVYEFLGNCWIAAREYDRAIEPLGRAGELADTGEPYVRLAEVYFQREDWQHAAEVLQRGFGKGKLKRLGNAQLLMGLALYNQKKVQDARAWFERASAHSESQAQAEGWLRHTQQELNG
jgi:tetratricopeptide (TPR) repeat protein